MTVDGVLDCLDGVRRSGRGWVARCPVPSHGQGRGDRSPSLSVQEGDDGRILVHDFGGCRVDEICTALGLRLTDLFPEQGHAPHQWRESQRRRDAERARQARERRGAGLCADVLREAERVIRAARGMDIRTLSDAQLDGVLNTIGDAFNLLENERYDGPAGNY